MFDSLQYLFRRLAIAFCNGKAMGLGSILIRLVTLLLPNMKVNEPIKRLCEPDEPAGDLEVAPKIVEWTFDSRTSTISCAR